MLRGTIDVQSQVGKGTEVTLRLPLSRLPGTGTPASTPSSSTSEQSTDESINALRLEHGDASVGLFGFNDHGQRPVLTSCVQDWLGLNVLSPISPEVKADVCIVDEKELAQLSHHSRSTLPLVILCNNATRSQIAFHHHIRGVAECISKPVGPRKLAKALRSCLGRVRSAKSGLTPAIALSDEASPLESEADTVVPDLEMNHLTLESEDGDKPLEVQSNEVVTASESENAQMAIGQSHSTSVSVTANEGFFFPTQEPFDQQREIGEDQLPPGPKIKKKSPYEGALTRRDSRRPPLISRVTEPVAKTPFPHASTALNGYDEGITFPLKPADHPQASPSGASQEFESTSRSAISEAALPTERATKQRSTPQTSPRKKRPPRLLLVDDNKINLRLLETYMRKRKYEFIDSAENGQFAVQAAEAHQLGYDIIFMGRLLSRKVKDCSDPLFRYIDAGYERI